MLSASSPLLVFSPKHVIRHPTPGRLSAQRAIEADASPKGPKCVADSLATSVCLYMREPPSRQVGSCIGFSVNALQKGTPKERQSGVVGVAGFPGSKSMTFRRNGLRKLTESDLTLVLLTHLPKCQPLILLVSRLYRSICCCSCAPASIS